MHFFFRGRGRITEGGDAVHRMIFRDAPRSQQAADRRQVADVANLVDPHGADAEGPGGEEDIFHGTGIVLHAEGADRIYRYGCPDTCD